MANYRRVFAEKCSYFITVVTHQRNPILIENIELLRDSFRVSKIKYPYKIEAIVILPEHFYMIISPMISTDYPKIIRAIKYHFSQNLASKYYENIEQSSSRWQRGLKPIWQKRYYEHTIRDEKDYLEKMEYIKLNPLKHQLIDNDKDWEYSSFYREV
ncbi:MAG: hypothetical protein KN64_13390 [Sulfurovum sp. AS07-7]|nr:MAG: hypothetical protein KN64_13390 [Sulfurovum sp. AS07-7]